MELNQEEAIQHVLASDLPHALQLTWIAMWEASEGGIYAGSIAEVGRMRDISRQAASKQVGRLVDWGALDDLDGAYRMEVDIVNPKVDNRNPDTATSEVDDVNPKVDNRNPNSNSPQGKKKSSTKEKTQPPFDYGSSNGARAREDGDPFEVEVDSVEAITRAAFGEPIRGLTVKDEIRTYCERAGPEGWDCLRSVCAMITRKGWNPTAALVKTKLTDQLALLNESDDTNGSTSDDFASQTQRLRKAARRGAGLDG